MVQLRSVWVAEGAHLLPRAMQRAVGQDALHSTGHSGMQPVSPSLPVCSLQEFIAQLKWRLGTWVVLLQLRDPGMPGADGVATPVHLRSDPPLLWEV